MSRRSGPAAPGGLPRARHRQVAYAAISALLRYPDEQLTCDLPLLEAAAGGLPAAAGEPLLRLISHLASEPLLTLQADYVATFDQQRRCCLYLSYYRNGDTRRRGAALWRFRDAYRRAGFRLAGSELPDYLPMLLELAASGGDGEAAAAGLMNEHREGIRMLLSALDARQSAYAGAVRALEAVLPPAGPHVIAAAARLAREGPPAELVGLELPGSLEPYPLPAAQAGGHTP
jgi:nitrate reductase molybdenum cofactor assembly chaperone NarJ/NarW